MKRIFKFRLLIITICIVFIIVIFTSKIFFVKHDSSGSKQQVDPISVSRTHDLSNSDKKFLKDHVYGQWKITKRLVKLDENGQDFLYNIKFNFSNQGVDEIKTIVLNYNNDYDSDIETVVGPNQTSFNNIRDLYLFGYYGGFSLLSNPIYLIRCMNSNEIELYNIYVTETDTKVPASIFKSNKVYQIYADTGVDPNTDPVVRSRTFGDTLYADPNDTNTLYLDFCGLGEMKRYTVNYNTNGKDTDGKG